MAETFDQLETYTPQLSVIGAILLWPENMGEAMQQLRPEDFLHPGCRVVWQEMCRMFRNGQTVDVVLLRDALTGFDNATAFLTSAMEVAPYAANFRAHIRALKRQAMLNRLRDLGKSLAEAADLDEATALLDQGNAISIRSAARERRSMDGMLRSFADRHSSQVKPDFLPWPIRPLNDGVKVTGGKFVVIGGYPSDGKTAFAIQSAVCQAGKNRRAAFYSFETDADTCEDRALACMAGISMEAIQDNRLTDADWQSYAQQSAFADLPFEVIAAAGMTVDDIRADALAHRYQVIYVDYLQLITPSRRNNSFSRFDEVSEISRSLQQLAKTTGITVVALSQMTRPAADKQGKVPAPTMHNLRESGQIEQDADVIMLIYRLDHKDIRAPRYLDVAKNKEGRTGRWALQFDGAHQRFALAARQDDAPPMPAAKKSHARTPVLSRDNAQMPFQEINGEDPHLPF